MTNIFAKALHKKSANVLKEKKSLLIFMALSNLLTVIVLILCIQPIAKIEYLSFHQPSLFTTLMLWKAVIIILILFTFINFFPLIFSASLIACLIKHLQKQPYSLLHGFKISFRKIWKIHLWQSLGNLYGAFFMLSGYWIDDFHNTPLSKKMLAQLPWKVATALMLPLLIENNLSIKQTISYCAELTRKTWCEDPEKILISNLSPKTIFTFIKIALFVGLIITMALNPPPVPMISIIIMIFCAVGILFLNTVTATIEAITLTAAYLFSQKKEMIDYYDHELLQQAFVMTKRKKL